jgi:hypothetical protein
MEDQEVINQDILGIGNISAERAAQESSRQRQRRGASVAPVGTQTSVPPVSGTGGTSPTGGTDLSTMTPEQVTAYIQSLGGDGNTGLPQNYQLPVRQWTNQATGQIESYSGNELINLTTGATQRMYFIDQDPTAIIGQKLQKQGPQGLLKFLKDLQSLGFYEGGRIGNGSSMNDIGAVASFLRYANMQGLEMNSALAMAYQQIPGNFRTGGGGGSRATNAADLRAVFQSVAMSTLGRGLKPKDVESMITAYQQIERSSSSVAPPSAQTYADEKLRGMFKGESEDFRAMNVADTMLNIIRSS